MFLMLGDQEENTEREKGLHYGFAMLTCDAAEHIRT